MADLRHLLQQAAATPSRPLEVEPLLAAVRRPRRRRRLRLLLGGLAAVLAGSVAVGQTNLVPADRDATEVHVVPGPDEPTGPDGGPDTGPAAVEPPVAVGDQPASTLEPASTAAGDVGEAEEPADSPPVSVPTAVPADAEATETAADTSSADEGCTATGNANDVETEAFGAGFTNYPECTYTATRPGGYTGRGKWRITLTRDGPYGPYDEIITSDDDPPCDVDVIQPGDRVKAVLFADRLDPTDWYVSVGTAAGC